MDSRFYIQVTFMRSTGNICPAGAYGNTWAWDETLRKLFVGEGVFDGVVKVRVEDARGMVVLDWESVKELDA